MLYLDTSLLVSALTNEAGTPRAQHWLGGREPDGLAISDWVVTEFSSALSIKLRSGKLTETERGTALSGFTRLVAQSIDVLAVSPQHFRAAARYADQHHLGLRAGDALHLAITVEFGATLYTMDRKLAEAGAALGADTVLL